MSVYPVCMARVNIYLPDDLAKRARGAGLNVSALSQAAIEQALNSRALDEWFNELKALPKVNITHEQTLQALDESREEFGRAADKYLGEAGMPGEVS